MTVPFSKSGIEKLISTIPRLETIRRRLTTYVRKERFCEGHLAGVCKSGHIVLVLKRLKELWRLGEIPAV